MMVDDVVGSRIKIEDEDMWGSEEMSGVLLHIMCVYSYVHIVRLAHMKG
jgi:hypothetical protein